MPCVWVALLAEGVDRNQDQTWVLEMVNKSPSSRRAWIEIKLDHTTRPMQEVALLAEGVDRNPDDGLAQIKAARRPPRGGRG